MIKQAFLILLFLLSTATGLYSQRITPIYGYGYMPGREAIPNFAIKSNILYNLAASFNIGIEMRTSDHLTLDISANYNPFTFVKNEKFKHVLVQPELRYWVNEAFNRHFIGAHLLYTSYNVGNDYLALRFFPSLKKNRFQGQGFGAGVSYGYQWILSPDFNFELSLGVGYIYFGYSKFEKKVNGAKISSGRTHYIGPTRLGFSLIYVL